MSDTERLLYLLGLVLLIAPVALRLRQRPRSALLYVGLWVGIAGVLALAYQLLYGG